MFFSPEISFFIADMKYDGTLLKFLELGRGTFSRFYLINLT